MVKATHTSEDNDSFNSLQEKAIEDHQRKYHWAFDNDKDNSKLLLLKDGTWMSKERRQLMDEACATKEGLCSLPCCSSYSTID
jgi:protein DGCR14